MWQEERLGREETCVKDPCITVRVGPRGMRSTLTVVAGIICGRQLFPRLVSHHDYLPTHPPTRRRQSMNSLVSCSVVGVGGNPNHLGLFSHTSGGSKMRRRVVDALR